MAYNLHDLRISGVDVLSIEACVIEGGLGEHVNLELLATIESEDVLFYEKEEKQPVEVYLKKKGRTIPLFYGIITQVKLSMMSGLKVLSLSAKSYSYLLDIKTRSRSFQDITMTYGLLIQKVLAPYGGKLATGFQDQLIGELIVQYEETDWQFLKRILSQVEITVTPESRRRGLCIYAGIPRLEQYKIDYKVLQIEKDLNAYYYLKANDQKVNDVYYMKYQVESASIRNIFERIEIGGQRFTVRSFVYAFSKAEMKAVYQLQKALGLKRKKRYPMHLIGVALEGSIIGIEKNKVQVHLEIDSISNKNRSFWFPYSTLSASPDGSGWYCMPEKGDFVRVYFPSKYTGEAIALSAVSKYKQPKGGGSDKMQDTNTKYLSTRHDKSVSLSPDGITVSCDGGAASLCVNGEGTLSLSAKNKIEITGQKEVSITAGNEISIHTQEEFVAQSQQGGMAILTADGKVGFQGTDVKVN